MKRLIAFGVLMVFFSVVVLAQNPAVGTKTDPIIGTWKVNPEKSTPKPAPGTLSLRQYLLRPDGFMVTIWSRDRCSGKSHIHSDDLQI